METIKQVLMSRDSMTSEEADNLINEALEDLRLRLDDGNSVDDICEEYFGLDPDFMEELMDRV